MENQLDQYFDVKDGKPGAPAESPIGTGRMQPLAAIRRKCLECTADPRACGRTSCPLWTVRPRRKLRTGAAASAEAGLAEDGNRQQEGSTNEY